MAYDPSAKWSGLSEEQKDEFRARLRRGVAMGEKVKHDRPASRQHLIRALDAMLMEDQVEMGLCTLLLMAFQEAGMLDRPHEWMTRQMEALIGGADPLLLDPQRN